MTNKINDGGAAFPSEQGETQEGTWNQSYQSGMTLRDYFAAKAMQSYIAVYVNTGTQEPDREYLSDWAYNMADNMLKAREEQS